MAGNTFGQLFKITTFGESHGPALGVVIDGVPPGITITQADIQTDLDRRRPGQSRITTQRQEQDQVEILSGIFEDKTTGTPVALLIRNTDQRPQDYSQIKNIFRPGHADFTFLAKYGIRDYRGGGRSSGRETAARVAAGAIAKKILEPLGVKIIAYTLSVGRIAAKSIDFAVIEKNMVRSPDLSAAELMIEEIEKARRDLDSLGGIVEAQVFGCPPGLGDPVFDKVTARLSYALMSIGTLRGIEFGDGFQATTMRGSQHNDPFIVKDNKIQTQTNHCAGILGGITTAGPIILRVAVKPPSSIAQEQNSVTTDLKPAKIQVKGRHDPCICPRVVPVVEAMIAVTLADCFLIQKSVKLDEKNII